MPTRARKRLRSCSGRRIFTPSRIYFSLGPLIGIEIVHPVQHPQKRRFSAAGRPNKGRHLMRVKGNADALQGKRIAIVKFEVSNGDLLLERRGLDHGLQSRFLRGLASHMIRGLHCCRGILRSALISIVLLVARCGILRGVPICIVLRSLVAVISRASPFGARARQWKAQERPRL